MDSGHRQAEYSVCFDWGLDGANELAVDIDVAVVIDVLSFTTTLSVALDRGTTVFPYSWNDCSAAAFADQQNAVLAVSRAKAVPGQITLSPLSVRTAQPLQRLVLPSPNGSTIALHLYQRANHVLGASLRNAAAVAQLITDGHDPGTSRVAVIAAGERWSDGSLRPAVEDLWGSGALISALHLEGWTSCSPEAQAAAAAWTSVADRIPESLSACVSGRELIDNGYGDDVLIAAEVDRSVSVPLLREQRFISAPLNPLGRGFGRIGPTA